MFDNLKSWYENDTVLSCRFVFFDLFLGSGPSTDDGFRLMGNRAWTCAFRAEAKALATPVSFVRNFERVVNKFLIPLCMYDVGVA